MKKAVLLVAALAVICSFAFAAEPKAELKISEFTGDASVTLGVDIGTGSAAFSNVAEADIKVELTGGGDKTTTGDNIWGELVIKTDGDPLGFKVQQSAADKNITETGDFNSGYFFPYGFKVYVDVAKVHFGSMFYIGIKKDATNIDFVQLPDTGAAVYLVDPTQRYGQVASGYKYVSRGVTIPGSPIPLDPGVTVLADDAGTALGVNAPFGFVAGVSLPNIVNIDVDLRSINEFNTGAAAVGSNQLITGDLMNRFGIRAKADITAVPNLTALVAVGTGFGGKDQKYDIAFGGKVSYKIPVNDKIFVLPKVAMNALYDAADDGTGTGTTGALDGTKDLGFIAQAGVLLGWGDKSKLNLYFSPDKDNDWGYYPGVEVGAQIKTKKVIDPALVKDIAAGLTISAFSGTIVEGLSANAALEIDNILKDSTELSMMGATLNAKYDIKADPAVITPKLGIYFLKWLTPDGAATGAGPDEFYTDAYVKAGVDVTKIIPNTTLSLEYDSNDLVGGVGNVPSAEQIMVEKSAGMFSLTVKVAF